MQKDVNIEPLDIQTAMLVHEIKNPLTTIKGFLQLVKPHVTTLEHEQYIQMALEEIDRTNDLLCNYLSVTKQRSTKRFLLHPVTNHVVEMFRPLIKQSHVQLISQLDRRECWIQGNLKDFQQVLINLIKNAVEAIEDNKKEQPLLSIQTVVGNGRVLIKIVDNGCGMTSDMMGRIFTPYHTTKSNGSGLGLPFCRDIINQLGGQLEFSSTEGIGTTCTITLPLA